MADRFDLDRPSRAPVWIPVALTAFAIAFGVWRLRQPDVQGLETALVSPSAQPSVQTAALTPRCTEISATPFVIGDVQPKPATAGSDGGSAIEPSDEVDDPTAPFAVEVGRGAAFEGGFAVGLHRDEGGSAWSMVATLAADGTHGEIVRLGRSRGDLDAPVVAGAGASVLTVMVEPNAGGRALKVAKITGRDLAWGPELEEGRDESLAVGIAASGARAVVVWDDLAGSGESARSSVMLASFDVATMRSVTAARPVSPRETDASSPHVVARPGGYWLAYVARGEEDAKRRKKPPKSDAKPEDRDESDDQGEAITTSWIEVVPLDEAGSPLGAPRPITPRAGHVPSFDLALGENGNALLAFRDNDTPTGGGGGSVSATVVRLGGGSEPHVLVERAGGPGAPDLLPGWVSIASVSGATRIAALSPSGNLLDELAPEPSLGAGEPIAARPDGILWARPLGKAMRLSVVRCTRREAADGADGGSAP